MARDRPLLWVEPCGYGCEDEGVGIDSRAGCGIIEVQVSVVQNIAHAGDICYNWDTGLGCAKEPPIWAVLLFAYRLGGTRGIRTPDSQVSVARVTATP